MQGCGLCEFANNIGIRVISTFHASSLPQCTVILSVSRPHALPMHPIRTSEAPLR
jgi:hypothetical protein